MMGLSMGMRDVPVQGHGESTKPQESEREKAGGSSAADPGAQEGGERGSV